MGLTNPFWEGMVELENVLVSIDPMFNCSQTKYSEHLVDPIWKEFQKKHPQSYDGSLVLLEDFEVDEKFSCGCELLTLHLSKVNFSTFIACKEIGTPLNRFGVLGTQCAILSPDKSHIIVGRRGLDNSYCPGKLTIPGGMLETTDLQQLQASLMREVREEIAIEEGNINNIQIKTMLREHENFSTIILLTAILYQPFYQKQTFKGNDEWQDKKLFWLSFEALKTIPDHELMEGLTYLKRKTISEII